MAAPSAGLAERSIPYGCLWVSEVTPDAVILFSSTNGTGVFSGARIYREKHLMAFQEGQAQRMTTFRGTIGFWNGRKPDGP